MSSVLWEVKEHSNISPQKLRGLLVVGNNMVSWQLYSDCICVELMMLYVRCTCNINTFKIYFIPVMAKLNFQHQYSCLQCHMILQ